MGDYHSSCSLYVSTNNLLSMLKWRVPRKGCFEERSGLKRAWGCVERVAGMGGELV